MRDYRGDEATGREKKKYPRPRALDYLVGRKKAVRGKKGDGEREEKGSIVRAASGSAKGGEESQDYGRSKKEGNKREERKSDLVGSTDKRGKRGGLRPLFAGCSKEEREVSQRKKKKTKNFHHFDDHQVTKQKKRGGEERGSTNASRSTARRTGSSKGGKERKSSKEGGSRTSAPFSSSPTARNDGERKGRKQSKNAQLAPKLEEKKSRTFRKRRSPATYVRKRGEKKGGGLIIGTDVRK